MGAGSVISLLPPPQYDVTPPLPVVEKVLSLADLQKMCHEVYPNEVLGHGQYWRGCARFMVFNEKKWCVVWRIDDERVRRHELGHCAGWPADHPGGRE